MKIKVSVIGAQASNCGSRTPPNGSTIAPMPRNATAITSAIRRSVRPAGRFASTTPLWSAASLNQTSQNSVFCRTPCLRSPAPVRIAAPANDRMKGPATEQSTIGFLRCRMHCDGVAASKGTIIRRRMRRREVRVSAKRRVPCRGVQL